MPEQDWLKPREVADICRVGVPTVWGWIHDGLLPASKLASGVWRIRRADLEQFMNVPA